MEPATIAGALGTRLLGRAGALLVEEGVKRVLGDKQQRAMERAVAQATRRAAKAHPQIAETSVEIDLLADDAVVEEVLTAAQPDADPTWEAAQRRWRATNETEPPPHLQAFLTDLADELQKAIMADETLQGAWTARGVRGVSTKADLIAQAIDKLYDPLEALRRKGELLQNDPTYALTLVSAIKDQVQSGPFGRAFTIDYGEPDSPPAMRGLPGSDFELKVTKLAPNTPEGRAELEALTEALNSDARVDWGEVEVEAYLEGKKLPYPSRGQLLSGPARRRVQAVVELRAARLPRQRFLVNFEQRRSGKVAELESVSNSRGNIKIRTRFDGDTRRFNMEFKLDDTASSITVADQIILWDMLEILDRGGRFEMWIPETNIEIAQKFPGRGRRGEARAVANLFRLLQEVQETFGFESGAVEEFSARDVAVLQWARRLARRGVVRLAKGDGTLTLGLAAEGYAKMRETAGKRGRVRLVLGPSPWPVRLSFREFDAGPVYVTLQNALVPKDPVGTGGETVRVTIPFDNRSVVTLSRAPPLDHPRAEPPPRA